MDNKLNVKRTFVNQLYQNIIQEVIQEIDDGFPLLEKNKSIATAEILQVTKQVGISKSKELLITLVKRSFLDIFNDLPNELENSWGRSDESIWQVFQKEIKNVERHKLISEMRSEMKILEAALSESKIYLVNEFQTRYGLVFQDLGYHICHSKLTRDWEINTTISMKIYPATPFTINQQIKHNSGWSLLPSGVNLFSLWGIYSAWELITKDNINDSLESIIIGCNKFIDIATIILKDLQQPILSEQELLNLKLKNTAQLIKKRYKNKFISWSLDDAKREVHESFPLVKQINNRFAIDVISAMDLLDKGQQLLAIDAMVKHANWRYLTKDQVLSQKEIDILANTEITNSKHLQKYQNKKTGISFSKTDIKYLKSSLKKKITPTLGPVIESAKFSWKHQIYIEKWRVNTTFNIEENTLLSYLHCVSLDSNIGILDVGCTHLLGWLGIGETYLHLFYDVETKDIIESLNLICSHFIKALPDIVSGINIDHL